jgi:hypothetical protein
LSSVRHNLGNVINPTVQGTPAVEAIITNRVDVKDTNSDLALAELVEIKDKAASIDTKLNDLATETTLDAINSKIVQTADGIKTKSLVVDGDGNEIDIKVLLNANALKTMIVNANGDQITQFGLLP